MNLVVVEDSELVLNQLLRLIATQSAITVAGVAADEESAVSVICTTHPDAVILDLSLLSGSGINVLSRIRAAGSHARVLILTNHTTDTMRRNCESHGIDGFYDKSHQAPACLDHLFSWVVR
jgi:DNA-binding NarL/FixJ family response regulator